MSPKTMNCKECGEAFPSRVKLNAHMRIHSAETPTRKSLRSASLQKKEDTFEALPTVTTRKDDKKTSPRKTTTPKKTGFTCTNCSKVYTSQKFLKRHESSCLESEIKEELPSFDKTADEIADQVAEVDENDSVQSDNEQEASSGVLNPQIKGKITTRVKTFLKESCTRRSEVLASCNSGENKNWMRCDKCPKEFKLKASLDRHKKVVHMEGASHRCTECGTRCADKGTLARHMYIHTGLKPYQCEKCKTQFSRKYHLLRHSQQTSCSGTPPPTFPCQLCGKVFSRNDNLREHLRIHAGDKTRNKKHTCEYCGKQFSCPSMLTVHIRMHTGEKPFECEECGKAFKSDGALKKHCRIHTGERPYECKDCGARFTLKGTLNRHLRTHTGIRPHKCHFCGKAFIQVGGLKAHLFHHTGENGFPCDQCNKCFNRKARLEMHIRYIHEKVKPYKCDHCGKAFVRKEDRNRHAVLHTGVKAFHCPTCNKSFAIKPSLKLHLLTHTREEPKSCSECGRAFIRQDCLLRHMRRRHREMLEKLILNVEKKVLPIVNTEITAARPMAKDTLSDSIRELLSLLVDEATLKAFGWPDKPVDELLESVIRRCGHAPVNDSDYSFMDRLRENCKLLFTVVIDDTAVKTLLNNHTVDEVILHVLRLAKT